MTLTSGAGRPQAFPLLKVNRQCCVGGSFSQVDPKPTWWAALFAHQSPRLQASKEFDHGGINLIRPFLLGPVAAAREHNCPSQLGNVEFRQRTRLGKRDEGLLAVDRLLAPGALRRKIVNSPILGIADHLAAVIPDDRDSSWVLHLLSDILRARVFAQGGTRSSNPLSSSGESNANLTSPGRARRGS
jgi:hypothetical protein